MTYAELEALIGQVALDNLEGHFHCGGNISLKEAVDQHGYPVIHLDPLTGSRDIERGSKTAVITVGFFEQGGDVSNTELKAIYDRQERASSKFLVMLQEEEEIGNISVRDTMVKNYTEMQLTGIACEFTLKLSMDLCF